MDTHTKPTRMERLARLTRYRDELRLEIRGRLSRERVLLDTSHVVTRSLRETIQQVADVREARYEAEGELVAVEGQLALLGVGQLKAEHVTEDTHCLDHILEMGVDSVWCPACAEVGHLTCHHPDHEDFCIAGEG